jgi:hypothetical protein
MIVARQFTAWKMQNTGSVRRDGFRKQGGRRVNKRVSIRHTVPYGTDHFDGVPRQ